MKIDKTQIKKILVIKFGGLGDVLLATPIFTNLKEYFPEAEINLLTNPKCSEVTKDNPYITRTLTFGFTKEESKRLSRNIRNQNYDLIIDLFTNPRTAFVTFRSKAKYRVGYNFRYRKYAYNIIIESRSSDVHNVDFNFDALLKLEVPIISKNLYIEISDAHEEYADKYFKDTGINSDNLMGIICSGGWESKRYKVEDYITLIGKIFEKYKNKFILFWGTEKEKAECELINKKYPDFTYIVPECGIRYAAAIMKKCKLCIGNDSGLLHIAVAAGVPVLGIYGPTNPKLQGPYGDNNLTIVNNKLDCLNCNLLDCPIGNICMTELSKDEIVKSIGELIKINNIIL